MNDDQALARRVLAMLDATLLGVETSADDVLALCRKADSPAGRVAAVCVRPEWIGRARGVLGRATRGDGAVRVASVANFPAGRSDIDRAVDDVRKVIKLGADEVDLVFPWHALLEGNEASGQALVAACREASRRQLLKVILETGELREPELIQRAAELAIAGGADFLKTSTGTTAFGATPQAVTVLLATIRVCGRDVGCKVSGGVRTLAQAIEYVGLADDIMGEDWPAPARFRIGASGLLDQALQAIDSRR
jgi:deoxyribose-phosphate aldolase